MTAGLCCLQTGPPSLSCESTLPLRVRGPALDAAPVGHERTELTFAARLRRPSMDPITDDGIKILREISCGRRSGALQEGKR